MPTSSGPVNIAAAILLALASAVLVRHLCFDAPLVSDPCPMEQIEEEGRKMVSSSWVDADNVTHTVTTSQQDGETWEEMLARHKDRVDAAKAIWPPA